MYYIVQPTLKDMLTLTLWEGDGGAATVRQL